MPQKAKLVNPQVVHFVGHKCSKLDKEEIHFTIYHIGVGRFLWYQLFKKKEGGS